MSSPFKSFENAVLIFQVPTGNVTTNSVGNRVVETGPVELKAMLKPVKDAAEVQFYVGDDETSELMSGYLTEPTVLPASVHPPIEGTCEVKTAIGVTRTGHFKLLPHTNNPYLVSLNIAFLSKIIGIFRRD